MVYNDRVISLSIVCPSFSSYHIVRAAARISLLNVRFVPHTIQVLMQSIQQER